MSDISRRELLLTLPALALAPRAFAQGKPQIKLKGFNHFKLLVSDVKRSVDFYQGLFGMPIQARQDETVILRLGSGPQFVAIGPTVAAAAHLSDGARRRQLQSPRSSRACCRSTASRARCRRGRADEVPMTLCGA